VDCSILIATRNRAAALERTLHAFRHARVPDGLCVEMIVADNGSSDGTAELVAKTAMPRITLRRLLESRQGKSRALNAAIAAARGDALLFTDDDVVPSPDWIERMAAPLLDHRCEAVAGRILLAAELRRPWLTPAHARWLAEVPRPAEVNPELVGASMGVCAGVFRRIPGFDVALGPGATGLGEETLLWMQMCELRMRILPADGAEVVHHPDPARLDHAGWIAAARQQGRTQAYIRHHWKHRDAPDAAMIECLTRIKLRLRSLPRACGLCDRGGCPPWELGYRTRIAFLQAARALDGKPRNYPPPAARKAAAAIF
jgi:glycosyltransferase involved in cell wall biosynthesis